MCGIFGASNVVSRDLGRAKESLDFLALRGPDGQSFEYKKNIFIGHRRLSINDLSSNGTQPMEAGGIFLTVNGEIYNFKELRAELEQKFGILFKSHSDSEVLLHGYICWGIETLLERVDGIFALALWDSHTNKIILANDHAGVKPLYYGFVNGHFAWASELKALEHFFEGNLVVDRTAVYDFLTYLYVPAPKSLYEGIFKLETAQCVIFDVKKSEIEKKWRYWQLPVRRDVDDEAVARKLVKQAIETTIEEQLVADVPVGTFLSGGVDSSIVSYEAARRLKKLHTCSIQMADEFVDETRFAQQVATLIGSCHAVRPMDQQMVNRDFKRLREWFDEPFGDTSAFPTYVVSGLAKETMTVVLTGDGGDELFGGYNHYTQWYQALTPWLGFLFPLRRPVKWVKNNCKGVLGRLARKLEVFTLKDPLERRVRLRGGLLHDDALKCVYRNVFKMPEDYDDLWSLRPYYRPDLPLKSRAMYLDFYTTMVDGFLVKVDRTSMAVAVEARVPFLAKRMIEVAWRVSERVLFKDGVLKGLLKAMYADVLPRECLYRSKQGFSVGKARQGDVLYTQGKALAEVILRRNFPELLKGVEV